MPGKAEGLVLTVDPNVIHKVDTNNPHNLFNMWTVFSRCAESVEQGRRLENLSWRLWTREALCCDTTTQTKTQEAASVATTIPPQDIPNKHRIPDVPQLSGSVDSVPDDEAIELITESDPVEILRPHIQRQDSCASSRSRGRERHITSDHLEKMVVTIIKEKEPNLSPLQHIIPSSVETDTDNLQSSSSEVEETAATLPAESIEGTSSALTSQTSTSSDVSEPPATTVIRGFSPSQFPSASAPHEPRSPHLSVVPEPHASPAPKLVQAKKQPAKFALGSSSGDESLPSPEVRQPVLPPKKNKMFQLGGSSGSTEGHSPSLKSALHSGKPSSLLGVHKKQTSFSNQITMRTISTPSDQSCSDVDESAIDDDDEDSEWEDSIEESGKSSVDEKMKFGRVPSRPNLTSQRSLISLLLAGQEERAKGLSNYASHSTPAIAQRARHLQNGPNSTASPNDSEDTGLEMRGSRRPALGSIAEIPRSAAQPIMSKPTTHCHQAALSPRTTRRNMLATELTESLRRQLLWERQQKSSTANAVLKRRHTSHDVANLKQYPERSYMNRSRDEINANSWNQFLREENGGYHAQGW